MKHTLIAATAAALAAGSVAALAGTYEAWGHTFTYGDFKQMSVDVAVATEKGTGHKMNLIRMKNGHMMALVPADRYLAMMPGSDESDMLR